MYMQMRDLCMPVCACVCVCVCVCVCQRRTKDSADGMREKVPIPLYMGFEPVPLGCASTVLVLPITPRG